MQKKNSASFFDAEFFVPLRGEVEIDNNNVLGISTKFPSPCGDGTFMLKDWTKELRFSPPYGDGTIMDIEQIMAAMFSPPYGENPLSHGLRRASSPEGGAYSTAVSFYHSSDAFPSSQKSSPFGRAGAQRLRGFLRGEVEIRFRARTSALRLFPSPYGDGTPFTTKRIGKYKFPSPYGDKL